ncbi:MAG: efflux RND transporter periplasmic adaptor subunit [Ignavibacteriaceae bacterium]
MKKEITIYGLISVALVIIAYFLFFRGNTQTEKFTYAQIKKGNIITMISSTGTMEAVSTVDVGTQVSGKIAKIFVDFNSHVRKGQLLAIIDTTALSQQVQNAKAALLKAKAQYILAKAQYAQNVILNHKGFLSDLDLITSKSTLVSDSADVESANGSLLQAKTNLGYAYIYSPINGVIINKNVLEGNTVAASLQAPVLFSIAEDLSKMQILASVDESDIGQIKDGQTTDFSVEAYPDKKFMGKVVQIRLNSQVISNVVEYTVVINADNKDNLLLPGMTATVDFYVAQKDSVLMIPNEALGFLPDQQTLAKYKTTLLKNGGTSPINTGISSQLKNGGLSRSDSAKRHYKNLNIGKVWSLDENGNLKQNFLVLGITDGKNTEIVKSKDLKEGMNVIIGTASATNGSKVNSSAPGRGMPRGIGRGL